MTPNENRMYVVLQPAERAKLRALGGSAWISRMLADQPEPEVRPARAVPAQERDIIASAQAPAKIVARQYRVSVDFVYYARKRAKPQSSPLPGVPHAPH
jgi:hypothetical protein